MIVSFWHVISLFWIFVHNYYVDYVRMLGYIGRCGPMNVKAKPWCLLLHYIYR